MLHCAEDALDRLEEAGVLQEVLAPGGRAHGWRVVCCGHSLGAGVSWIIAMLLRRTVPNVHYVGFEPPGGLASPSLARVAQKLGWVAAVCANDWIARLSIRNVQSTRERVLDAIVKCQHSKLGILILVLSGMVSSLRPTCACITLLRKPLVQMLQCLAGGPLMEVSDVDCDEEPCEFRSKMSILRRTRAIENSDGSKLFPRLWPAGNIVYFRPVAQQELCGGWYQHDTQWVAEWVQPADLDEIIISFKSVEYHFPNILKYAYSQAAVGLGAIAEQDYECT